MEKIEMNDKELGDFKLAIEGGPGIGGVEIKVSGRAVALISGILALTRVLAKSFKAQDEDLFRFYLTQMTLTLVEICDPDKDKEEKDSLRTAKLYAATLNPECEDDTFAKLLDKAFGGGKDE